MRTRIISIVLLTSALAAAQSAGPGAAEVAKRFDAMYSAEKKLYKTDANAFLVAMAANLKPGTALDVAMGQGRNAVWLASQGWNVTGYDVSEEGLRQARAAAASRGLKVNAVRASHQDFDIGRERWDLIVMTYALADMEDQAFLRRIQESLKPGGLVLVEQFNAAPVPGAKGPANALFKTFASYRVLHYEDVTGISEWGFKEARLGRILAQKE
jgi:2-polyprenyl-3-methyl-5-hydroxy-6-metoxy-1,4-benzoquinol methylase